MSSKKSTFVTNISWVLIVLSGFMLIISIMQNLMISLVFPIEEMQELNQPTGFIGDLSKFILDHINALMIIVAFLFAGLFTSSIGLLKRKNWARFSIIVFMVIGIIYSLGGAVLQWSAINAMDSFNSDLTSIDPTFDRMMLVVKFFTFLLSGAMTGFFGWTIYKLLSKPVAKEFN